VTRKSSRRPTSEGWQWSSPAGGISGTDDDAPTPERRFMSRALSTRVVLAVLLAAATCPYFVGLDDSSIWDANEAFYVETPREMLESGDYVSPRFNYEPRLNKPVLSYWIVVAFYKLFGVSVGVQRLPIALGAMVLIATAFFLARAAHSPAETADSTGRTNAALWAALGLAITPRLLMFSRRIFIDIYIAMFMALTLLFFVLADRYPARRRLFLLLMYASVGLGVLTKGPVAAVVPFLVFAAYLLFRREVRRVSEMMLPAGVLIVLAIVVPWYAALYVRYGWTYIGSFFLGENLARYTEGYGVNSVRGPLFYVPVLFGDSFPWSAFLFASAIASWRSRRRTVEDDRVARPRTVLWLWIGVIVLFFSLSAAKQDLYIFPIVPAVAALAGVVIARGLAQEPRAAKAIRMTTAAIGVIVAVIAAGVVYLFRGGATGYALDGALLTGAVGIAGGASATVLALAFRLRAALLAVAVTFIVLNWVFVLRVLPSFETYKPSPGFARTLEPRLTREAVVATYDEALPSLVFYLRRHVDQLFEEEKLIALLKGNRPAYAVLSGENYAALSNTLGTTCVIERRPTFDVKLKNVISRDPLPELLLITNRCGFYP
jgi:4-amino-4-deoxy-L-arabinose transferase-like glycosyltransferase